MPLLVVTFFTSCNDDSADTTEFDNGKIQLFSTLRFSANEIGSDEAQGEWNEWAARYMWQSKGVVNVRYDNATDQYIVDGEQLKQYGFPVRQKEYTVYDLQKMGLDFPKSEEPFQIYAVADLQGDLFRIYDYFLWPSPDGKFPKSKEQGKNEYGFFNDWKANGMSEDDVLYLVNYIAYRFEGIDKWYNAYPKLEQRKFHVKYCAAIDAFVGYPEDLMLKGCVLYVFRNFNPEDRKTNTQFNIWAAGKMAPCNERLHEKDGRLYKYFDVVDAFVLDNNPESYHDPIKK